MSEQSHNKNLTQLALIKLKNFINHEIIGQEVLVERMLIGLLAIFWWKERRAWQKLEPSTF
jgi:MoxR-like ATPase